MKKIFYFMMLFSPYLSGMEVPEQTKKHFREFRENGKTSFIMPDYYYYSHDKTWALNETKKIILSHRSQITNPERIKKIENALESSTYELIADPNSKSGAQKALNLSPLYEQFHRNLPLFKRHPIISLYMLGMTVAIGTVQYTLFED